MEAATQLKNEIENIIHRYGMESDVSVFTAIGALEAVKANLLDRLAEITE